MGQQRYLVFTWVSNSLQGKPSPERSSRGCKRASNAIAYSRFGCWGSAPQSRFCLHHCRQGREHRALLAAEVPSAWVPVLLHLPGTLVASQQHKQQTTVSFWGVFFIKINPAKFLTVGTYNQPALLKEMFVFHLKTWLHFYLFIFFSKLTK